MSKVKQGNVSYDRASAINIWNECRRKSSVVCEASWKTFLRQYADLKRPIVKKLIMGDRARAEIPKEVSPSTVEKFKATKLLQPKGLLDNHQHQNRKDALLGWLLIIARMRCPIDEGFMNLKAHRKNGLYLGNVEGSHLVKWVHIVKFHFKFFSAMASDWNYN